MYRQYAEQLVKDGHAYYAFDTPEELEKMRHDFKTEQNPSPQYDHTLRMKMRNSLSLSDEDVNKLLKDETFQEDAQVKEKYHRATVSQVQLCSYYTGMSDILALREAYKNKMGTNYSLKDFHEKFLSYGSAPVKYIREVMLK